MPENIKTAVPDTRKRAEDRSSAGPIIGLEPGTSASTTSVKSKSDTSIIDFELNILGKQLNFHIGAAKKQARLADIVPLARTICAKITDTIVESTFRKGVSISCRKDCSACCSYLVPLSVPEAFSMREEVLDMPADQSKAVLRLCLDASRKILDDMPESFDVHLTTNSPNQVRQLSSWYAGLKLPCPFLSGGLCTIYEQRPTACREHIVTGSALPCEIEWMVQSQMVTMPVSVLEALGQLASELEGTAVEAVMLPLALPWTQDNPQRHQRTWPAIMMVERFVDIIKRIAEENSEAGV